MRCRMVRTLLPLRLSGALRPEVAEQVDEHLVTCAACRMVAHELKANQPEAASPAPKPVHPSAPSLSPPLAAYRLHATMTKAHAEVAGTAAWEPGPEVLSETASHPATAPAPRLATSSRQSMYQRPAAAKRAKKVAADPNADHPGWNAHPTPNQKASSTRSSKAVAQTIFVIMMAIMALVMGMAWRGASLRLDAHQQELTASAVEELQANLRVVRAQLQSPTGPLNLPPLSQETLAMKLLLKADPVHQESYLPLVEAHGQMLAAISQWRSEQASAPTVITASFASEVGKAIDEITQALGAIRQSWPPSADQRATIKQAAVRLHGLALSYSDEGVVPGQFPEAKVNQQAAIGAAARLLPAGAEPVKPTAVRRYQRRQGVDLWEISFTHNLQKWQVQVSADSAQVLGMTLPVPSKGDQITLEQAEQIARGYLTERIQADGFALVDRQEKDGQVVYTAQRVVDGLRYFSDLMKVGVARYGGAITYYQRLQSTAVWTDLPVFQLNAEKAMEAATTFAAAQKIASPNAEGALGVAQGPSHQERLVWGFATSDPKLTIFVDAQSGETWRSP